MIIVSSDHKNQLGLIGHDIAYSVSPKIHKASAKLLQEHCDYRIFDIAENKVSQFLEKFWHHGGLGLNITTPYKRLVGKLTSSSYLSVNTLYRGKNWWDATSTDGVGFCFALKKVGLDLARIKNIVILGNGGVVDSLLAEMSKVPFSQGVVILRRNNSYDKDLLAYTSDSLLLTFKECTPHHLTNTLAGKKQDTLFIQATNAPMHGESLQEFLPALKDYSGNFFELGYSKLSSLYYFAQKKGLKTLDGKTMLLSQALASQEYWWGRSASFDEVALTLEKELN